MCVDSEQLQMNNNLLGMVVGYPLHGTLFLESISELRRNCRVKELTPL